MLSPLPSPLLPPPHLHSSSISSLRPLRPAGLPFGIVPAMETPLDTPPLQHLEDYDSSHTLATILKAQNYLAMPTKESRDIRELRESAERFNQGILAQWSYDDLRGVDWNLGSSMSSPEPRDRHCAFLNSLDLDPEEEEEVEEECEEEKQSAAPVRRIATRSSVKADPPTPRTEGPRPRGRPHLNLSPESTVERRRAQVRTAQRTYRQRREATISSLEERNRHLEEVLSGMTEAFLRLQAAAMKVSDPEKEPALAAQLQQSTEAFLTLARSAYV